MGKWYMPSIFVDVISHSCANWTGGIALLYSRGGYPDSKVHGAYMGPIWVMSAPDGPHLGPMNFTIRVGMGE